MISRVEPQDQEDLCRDTLLPSMARLITHHQQPHLQLHNCPRDDSTVTLSPCLNSLALHPIHGPA